MVLESLDANLIACTSMKQGIDATYGRGMVDTGLGQEHCMMMALSTRSRQKFVVI